MLGGLVIVLQAVQTQQLILGPSNAGLDDEHEASDCRSETEPAGIAKVSGPKDQHGQRKRGDEEEPEIQESWIGERAVQRFAFRADVGGLIGALVKVDFVSCRVAELREGGNEVGGRGAERM